MLVATCDLLKSLDVREEVVIAIMDFSNTFDVVPHQRLLCKLFCMAQRNEPLKAFSIYCRVAPRVSLCPHLGFRCRMLIYRCMNSLSDKESMQKDLASLYDWGGTWGLKFNVYECIVMRLSRKSVHVTPFYRLGGEVIASDSESQYSGIFFTDYWTHSSQCKFHIYLSACKANQRLTFLTRGGRWT